MSVDLEIVAGAAVKVGEQNRPIWTPKLSDRTSRPVTLPASYQTPNPAFTYAFMQFPAVSPNKIWEIFRIGVTGADPFTTLAGVTVLAYRSGVVPQDSNTEPSSFGDLIAVLGSIPNTTYPARYSVVARAAERIILAIKGLTAGQQLQASMDIIEHDAAAYLNSLLDPS